MFTPNLLEPLSTHTGPFYILLLNLHTVLAALPSEVEVEEESLNPRNSASYGPLLIPVLMG